MSITELNEAAMHSGYAPTVQDWGTLQGGDPVRRFTLRNAQGARVEISDLGASLVAWQTPDRSGRLGDVVLGYEHPADYLSANNCMGSLVGRWANRIANARFSLDGVEHMLDRNEGRNTLHGGANGFHRQVWEAEPDNGALVMRLVSPEGDGGFPGQLDVQVRYTFDDEGTLTIRYEAVSDAPTPVNLTNHAYFNLSGRPASDIRGHLLWMDADHYLEVDAELIPTRLATVTGTAFDFRRDAPIGARLDWPEAQLTLARGFDHCFVLREVAADEHGHIEPRAVARVQDPGSGRQLTVITDQRGLQCYTGNHLSGHHPQYGALCLEAGGFPNHVNMRDAESMVIRPGQTYRQETRYKIDVPA